AMTLKSSLSWQNATPLQTKPTMQLLKKQSAPRLALHTVLFQKRSVSSHLTRSRVPPPERSHAASTSATTFRNKLTSSLQTQQHPDGFSTESIGVLLVLCTGDLSGEASL